ncbi:MAG: hypothetical protein LBL17_00925 [Coxiellaceae bacterium]|jgi:hypothetical protein|nr:hypothetical protein [Coxiellaceae bacterium]
MSPATFISSEIVIFDPLNDSLIEPLLASMFSPLNDPLILNSLQTLRARESEGE